MTKETLEFCVGQILDTLAYAEDNGVQITVTMTLPPMPEGTMLSIPRTRISRREQEATKEQAA